VTYAVIRRNKWFWRISHQIMYCVYFHCRYPQRNW